LIVVVDEAGKHGKMVIVIEGIEDFWFVVVSSLVDECLVVNVVFELFLVNIVVGRLFVLDVDVDVVVFRLCVRVGVVFLGIISKKWKECFTSYIGIHPLNISLVHPRVLPPCYAEMGPTPFNGVCTHHS
jgi:hypothetical protein